MVRTQIQLTPEQLSALRRLSFETGRSVAEIVRLGVDLFLSRQPAGSRQERIQRAMRLSGGFSSGRKDVSRNHDRYLAQAFRP
ncbi:MAG: CopG family transcriptional regulator [Acidobacteria bacterium]|nr:CopG family transcriptional regulator [Acidobacteriota bacterium]